jgi:hypothetical protein
VALVFGLQREQNVQDSALQPEVKSMLHFLLVILVLGLIVVLAVTSPAFRAFIFVLVAIFGLILTAAVTLGKKSGEESEKERAVASRQAAEYALAASTAIKASDLLFEEVTLSKAAYGQDEFAISGSVTNNSNVRLSSVHFDITLSDCLKSKCIIVGKNSVTVYADVPAGQKRAFRSRAMAFENLPERGTAAICAADPAGLQLRNGPSARFQSNPTPAWSLNSSASRT